MTDSQNRRILLARRPEGVPQPGDFATDRQPCPEAPEGGILVRVEYVSVDPAMRVWLGRPGGYVEPVPLGAVVRSFGAGTVVASRNPAYAPGDRVVGMTGWQEWAAMAPAQVFWRVEPGDLPLSLSLGILGINGIAAYFGVTEICRPTPGETLVVSTAAGSVGSAAGQIARILGARAVGITGSDRKIAQCVEDFGFDAAVSYRAPGFEDDLRAACPKGIDSYFDNTAGAISDAVRRQINPRARIALCGTAAVPSWEPWPQGDRVERHLLNKRALMQGFVVTDYAPRFAEARAALTGWVAEGRLRYREHRLDGLDSAMAAIALLYEGGNDGKLVVRL